MAKIKRVFVIEAEPVHLLPVSGKIHGQLNEIGLIKKIATALHGKKEEPAPPHRAHNTERQVGETAVDQLLDRVFVVPSNDVRAVMFLNAGDLKDLYLKKGGEKELVDSLSEEQLAGIFPNAKLQVQGKPVKPFIIFAKDGKFSTTMLKSMGDRNMAVLLNVPKSIASNFAAKPPTNFDEARKLMISAINHMYYVGTLDANRAGSVKIDATTDSDTRAQQFSIKKFIRAWPQRSVYDAAVDEQEEAALQNKPLPDPEPHSKGNEAEAKPASVTLTDEEKQKAVDAATEARRALNAATAKVRKSIEQQTGKQAADQLPTTKAERKELKDALEKILFNPSLGEKVAKAARQEFANSIRKTGFLDGIRDILQRDLESASEEEPEPTATAPSGTTPEDIAKMLDDKDDNFLDQVAKILAARRGSTSK